MAFGLHWLDFIIVAVCLCSVLLIGVWSARGIHRESDFFVGGRSLGSVLQFFLNFGLMSDSNGAPTIATEVYRQGVGGIWLAYQTLFLTPFYWFTSVWFRRTRLVTMADLFVDRFDSRSLAMAYAGVTILTSVLSLAIGNVISYKVAAAMIVKPPAAYIAAESAMIAEFADYRDLKGKFDAAQLPKADLPRYHELQDRVRRGDLQSYVSYLSPVPFYIVYTAIVATYIMMGGIKAAAITDALQGILIIAFSAFMVPAGLIKLGGFAALHAAVPDFRFRLFGSVELSDYTWYSIGAIILTSLVTAPAGGSPAQASAK
ncbi:MAG: sodium:solute symporter family protein, partial [Tepidisphaeraceae bacterium]